MYRYFEKQIVLSLHHDFVHVASVLPSVVVWWPEILCGPIAIVYSHGLLLALSCSSIFVPLLFWPLPHSYLGTCPRRALHHPKWGWCLGPLCHILFFCVHMFLAWYPLSIVRVVPHWLCLGLFPIDPVLASSSHHVASFLFVFLWVFSLVFSRLCSHLALSALFLSKYYHLDSMFMLMSVPQLCL